MLTVESKLYRAFNAINELRAHSFLAIVGTNREDHLTSEEMIVEGSMIRTNLQQNLPDTDFRILLLYFHNTRDLDATVNYMQPVQSLVKQSSKIFGDVDQRFFDLVCASEFWNINLFRQLNTPMLSFLRDGQASDLLTRRKKRIIKVLQSMRQIAMEKAYRLLITEPADDSYIDNLSCT